MEVNLNKKTIITPQDNDLIFTIQHKKKIEYVYLKRKSLEGVKIFRTRVLNKRRLIVFFVLAILGGLAHYIYDTIGLGYSANPLFISTIFGLIMTIGIIVSFQRKRMMHFLLDSSVPKRELTMPIFHYLPEDELDYLLEILQVTSVTEGLEKYIAKRSIDKSNVYYKTHAIQGITMKQKVVFLWKLFVLFFILGLIGGLAHYLYDTVLLEYHPNPTLISAIFGGITFIGVLSSIRKRQYLELIIKPDARIKFALKKGLSHIDIQLVVEHFKETTITPKSIKTTSKPRKMTTPDEIKQQLFGKEPVKEKSINIPKGNEQLHVKIVDIAEETKPNFLQKEKVQLHVQNGDIEKISIEPIKDLPKKVSQIITQPSKSKENPADFKEINYLKMNMTQLRRIARQKHVDEYYNLRKPDLIAAIKSKDNVGSEI